jgi:hypothetical protein
VGSVSAATVAGKCGDPGDSCSTILGISLAPVGTPSGEAEEAQGIFLGGLTSSKSDGLTSAFNGGAGRTTFPLLTGTDYSATLTGASSFNALKNPVCDPGVICDNGRFDTTGDFNTADGTGGAWWETAVDFAIDFDAGRSVSAFGFYATDHGDFAGKLQLELTDAKGGVLPLIDVPVDVVGTPDGTLLFFGFADTKRSFSRIRVLVGQADPGSTSTYDYIGFDDFVTGLVKRTTEPPGVPEPGSLVLVAASLAALAATRRRRPR